MEFTISKKAKNVTYGLMGIGLLGTIIGAIMDHSEHHSRIWANLLVDGFFFFAIGLGALFLLALQYATESGYGVVMKRVVEGVMSYIPIGGAVMVLILLLGTFNVHHLYQWMDADVVAHDHHIAAKGAYLNKAFFWIRTIAYMATFVIFARAFRKRSLLEDQVGGTEIHFINYRRGALFLVFFAVFSSTMSWDYLMSIDAHWYSTLFGWYVFSGMWVSAIIVIIMLIFYLQSQGHLKNVNDSHIHDMGKWMFAISFLWSYLWYFQFMLIWYADIPEEVTYFKFRIEHYKTLMFVMFAINFILPMLFLMSREAKRHKKMLVIIGLAIFIGHWFDMFVMVMPGTVGEHWHYGMLEIGMFLLFLGIFIQVVLNALTKAPLQPVHHPYLEESIHHHI